MKINKNTDSLLFGEYQAFRLYRSFSDSMKKAYVIKYFGGMPPIHSMFMQSEYCKNLPADCDINEAYTKELKKILDGLYSRMNVEYVSGSFLQSIADNSEKLIQSIEGINLYEAFGECAGFLVYDSYLFTYSITENISYFTVNHRNADITENDKICSVWDNQLGRVAFDSSEKSIAMLLGIATLVMKHFGEVQTTLIGSGVKRVFPDSEENVVKNDTPFKISYLDSSWLKTIIRTEGFLVRGFFRLQVCGVGRRERKLIYIKPFQKHGYVRRAKKLVYQEKAKQQALGSIAF